MELKSPCCTQHIVTYLVSRGRVLNIGAAVQVPELAGKVYPGPWVTAVATDKIVDRFKSWEPDVKDIVEVSVAQPKRLRTISLGVEH